VEAAAGPRTQREAAAFFGLSWQALQASEARALASFKRHFRILYPYPDEP
jgi:hypothetical protein